MKKQEREWRNKYVRQLLEAAKNDMRFYTEELKPHLTEDRLRAEYTFLRGIQYCIIAMNLPKCEEVDLAIAISERRCREYAAFKERTLDQLAKVDIDMQELKKAGKSDSHRMQKLWEEYKRLADLVQWNY